ncbi:hypothetical protein Tco_0365302 [Tanacetum coccineum]
MPWPNSSDAERLLLAVQYASQNQYFGREMIRSPRGLSFAGVQATLGDDLMLLIDMVRMQSSLKYMLRSEEREGEFTFVYTSPYCSTEALRPTVKTTVDLSTNVLYINDISSVLNLSIRSLPGDHGLPLQQVRICIPDVSDS